MLAEAKDEPDFRTIYEGLTAIGVNVFIVFGLLSIVVTLWKLAQENTTQTDRYLLLFAWGILPPMWFVIEYFFVFLPYGVKGSFGFFQYGQNIASKLWAAVFAIISIAMYKDKNKDKDKKGD